MRTILRTPFRSLAAATLLAALPTTSTAETNPESAANTPFLGGFGTAVVVDGGDVFVGRPGDFSMFPTPPYRVGAVVIYRSMGGTWTTIAAVSSADAEVGDGFGTAVDVDGEIMVVGAPRKDDGRGTAYVFERTGDSWTEVARLATAGASDGDEFGAAVAVSGGLVLVASPGRGTGVVTVFERNGDAWTEAESIEGPENPVAGRFGASLSLSGSEVIVGAPGTMVPLLPGVQAAPKPGAIYLFRRADGAWEQTFSAQSGVQLPELFGWDVEIDGDRAFASAPFGELAKGAVKEFARGDAGWEEVGVIVGPSPNTGFGFSFSTAGEDVWVGAPLAQGAYVHRKDETGAWQQIGAFNDSEPNAFYGAAVGADRETAIVGIPGADFFEGTGGVYAQNADGDWKHATTILDEAPALRAVLGGQVDCDDEGGVEGFGCADVDLVSFLPMAAIGGSRGDFTNDVWGWTDPETGIEYAIVGKNTGTSFVSLADPANPVFLGELPLTEGSVPNLWRDMKVYANHVFVVADNAGQHGMQVFDLTELRTPRDAPATFEEVARYTGIASAHNIVINEDTGFAFIVGASGGGETCGGALHMVDIRDPRNPTFAGCFADSTTGLAGTGYSHDAQCLVYGGPDEEHQGKEVCFGANENALSVADVTDKENPVPISTATYPNSAYLHQGWISEDQRYFYMNDELDEVAGNVTRTRTLVWDIADLDDPVLVTEHLGTNAATDHNMYVRDQFLYQSNYVSGLRVLDISDPENPVEVGYFDTVPWGADGPGFAGSFSNYPYFESNVIVVSSMREGVFFLKKRPRPVF